MEYMRLMRAKIRQSELIAESRCARLTARRQRTDPSRHLRPSAPTAQHVNREMESSQ